MTDPETIVAEITRNWVGGAQSTKPPICKQFEYVILVNAERGYELRDWKFSQVLCDQGLIETVIAIFKRRAQQPAPKVQGPAMGPLGGIPG